MHELRHAMQSLFGELSNTSEVAVDLLKATKEEAKVVGQKIENSVAANKGGSKELNRAIEEDAYVFAARNFAEIKNQTGSEQASSNLRNSWSFDISHFITCW